MPEPEGQVITGVLERTVYANEDNSYVVARLRREGASELTTIVGSISAGPGESLKLFGRWVENRKYGRQFQVERYESVFPASISGIQKYLGSGLIKGIGEVFASRIVETFGRETIRIIDESPERLLEVEGIGEGRLEKIRTAWADQKEIKRVGMFLQEHGVSTAWAVKIYKAYGEKAVAILSENPYSLASDIYGIGFKTADMIARNLGMDTDSPVRAGEALAFVLSELANEGHVYYPLEELLDLAAKNLEMDRERLRRAVADLSAQGRVVNEDGNVYLTPLWHAETGVAEQVNRLMYSPGARPEIDVERAIAWVEERNGIKLAELQKAAIEKALSEKVMVITGNPGCGKSTLVKGIIDILARKGGRIMLAAPTGRAAKRLSELSKMEARTIHRLLEYKKARFERNMDNPLEADLLVVDEASMIDMVLMNHLLRAVPDRASIILVGDVDQLPSVGAGNVLKDLIASGMVPVVALTEIFRQARDSMIVVNAHRINRGERPELRNSSSQDFFFIEEDEAERVSERIISLVSERLPRHYGLDPVRDIQVLSPMHRGVAGVGYLNQALQARLNPGGRPVGKGGREFRVGDKVMQMRNNYDLDVYNGDMGIVSSVIPEDNVMRVDYDGRIVEYDFSDLDELTLAYACSIHKAQGSEYPAVVVPVHTQHYIMLQRNLIYTALTRAKKLAVFVGSRKALAMAVRNDKVAKRYSGLAGRLGAVMSKE